MKEKEDSFSESNKAMVTEREENEMKRGNWSNLSDEKLMTCCLGMGPTKRKKK